MDLSTPSFEFSGGELCLDFANTWGDRGRPDTDLLRSYSALLAFTHQGGQLAPELIAALAARAQAQADRAARALATARSMRESLYHLLAGHARGRALDTVHLDRVNALLAVALPRLRLELDGHALRWAWADAGTDLEAPLWPVLRSAAGLLTSVELERVRECDGAQCTWLFLDGSRGRSRRWCSMASCGNRAKARRHYQRRGAASGSAPRPVRAPSRGRS